MKSLILILISFTFFGGQKSEYFHANDENPIDPLKHMEICRTKRCSGNDNSGRYGCARNCAQCDDQSNCKKWHGGIDLLASLNTDFYCLFSGVKKAEGFNKSWGFYLIVESENVKDNNGLHYDKITFIYCHLNPSKTFPAVMKQDDKLGLTGNTGNALNEAPHLHLEAYDGIFNNSNRSNAIDPQLFFRTALGQNQNNTNCQGTTVAELDCCGEFKKPA